MATPVDHTAALSVALKVISCAFTFWLGYRAGKRAPNNRYGDLTNVNYYGGKTTLYKMVAKFGARATINFCEINSFKYEERAGKKPNTPYEQDMAKARAYETFATELRAKYPNDAV